MNNKLKERFTGGDNLSGLFKKFHDIMMKNELLSGKGAYQFSSAGGRSGPSFGGNQMDLGASDKGMEALQKIIKSAKDESGKSFFDDEDLKQLKQMVDVNKKQYFVGKTAKAAFGDLLPKLNSALSSEYGKQVINEAYIDELESKAKHIENVWQGIKQPLAKAFYQSDFGKVLLFDYHNQLFLDSKGKFVSYLNAGQTLTWKGTLLNFLKKGSYTFEDHKEFLLNTTHGREKPLDVLRRLENIQKYFENEDSQQDKISVNVEITISECMEILNKEGKSVDSKLAPAKLKMMISKYEDLRFANKEEFMHKLVGCYKLLKSDNDDMAIYYNRLGYNHCVDYLVHKLQSTHFISNTNNLPAEIELDELGEHCIEVFGADVYDYAYQSINNNEILV